MRNLNKYFSSTRLITAPGLLFLVSFNFVINQCFSQDSIHQKRCSFEAGYGLMLNFSYNKIEFYNTPNKINFIDPSQKHFEYIGVIFHRKNLEYKLNFFNLVSTDAYVHIPEGNQNYLFYQAKRRGLGMGAGYKIKTKNNGVSPYLSASVLLYNKYYSLTFYQEEMISKQKKIISGIGCLFSFAFEINLTKNHCITPSVNYIRVWDDPGTRYPYFQQAGLLLNYSFVLN